MKMFIDAAQGQPSFTVVDDKNIIQAKVYACNDKTVVSTKKGAFEIPKGCRDWGPAESVPITDGNEV